MDEFVVTLKYDAFDNWTHFLRTNSYSSICQVVGKNGKGKFNPIILAALSPFLNKLLSSLPSYVDGCIIFPDVEFIEISTFFESLFHSNENITVTKSLMTTLGINLEKFNSVTIKNEETLGDLFTSIVNNDEVKKLIKSKSTKRKVENEELGPKPKVAKKWFYDYYNSLNHLSTLSNNSVNDTSTLSNTTALYMKGHLSSSNVVLDPPEADDPAEDIKTESAIEDDNSENQNLSKVFPHSGRSDGFGRRCNKCCLAATNRKERDKISRTTAQCQMCKSAMCGSHRLILCKNCGTTMNTIKHPIETADAVEDDDSENQNLFPHSGKTIGIGRRCNKCCLATTNRKERDGIAKTKSQCQMCKSAVCGNHRLILCTDCGKIMNRISHSNENASNAKTEDVAGDDS